MKRLVAFAFSALFVFSFALAGCKGEAGKTPEKTGEAEKTGAEAEAAKTTEG